MKKFLFCFYFLGGFLFVFSVHGTPCLHDETSLNCVKYIKNYDGDTVTVDIPDIHPLFGKNIHVRVRGVDTAEIKTEDSCEKSIARTTQRLVKSLLSGASQIHLKNIDRDKYFRILADIVFDGQSLAEILIRNRLAVAYDGGAKPKVDWCQMGRRP